MKKREMCKCGFPQSHPIPHEHSVVAPAPDRIPQKRVGVIVRCVVCGGMKKPIGRSGPLEASYCTDECPGYRQAPYVGSLWPNETSEEFGYTLGSYDGTVACVEVLPNEN